MVDVTIRATNDGGFAEETFSLDIISAPEITSSLSLSSGEVGIPQAWSALTYTGGGTPVWSIQSGAPTGFSISASTGVLSYNGALITNQTYSSIVIRITNEAGYDEATFSVVMAYTLKNEGFTVWQRADQSRAMINGSGGYPSNTEPVGWIADLIDGANPCYSEDDGGKPVYVSSAVNGKPGLQFNGITHRMMFTAEWAMGNDDYLVMVMKRIGGQNWNTWFGGSTVDGHHYAVLGQNSSNRINAKDNDNTGNIYNTVSFGTGYHIFRIWRSGTDLYAKIDSTIYGPFTMGSLDMLFRWFGYFGQNSAYSNSVFCEWARRTTMPDAEAITRIESYLSGRYSLAV